MYAEDTAWCGDVLVEQHMDLVRRIAYHMLGRLPATVQVEDLIQAGVVGLLEAGKQYDASHGASFETYAGIRIRGSMLDEVRRHDWTPRSANRAAREIGEAMRAVENRVGREATGQEVATEMGVDLERYHGLLRKVAETRVLSLEALFDDGSDYGDSLPSDTDDPSQRVLKESLAEAIAAAIGELPERERLVLSLYYGEELNLKEIGKVLAVTESRVCQIHGQALARLRSRLGDWRDEVRTK